MTDEFEHRQGYPAGTNSVREADQDDQAAAEVLARMNLAPVDLVTFYHRVGSMTWEDVGNGYFIHSATDVLVMLNEYGAVELGVDRNEGGLVIGSNGGGLSYVLAPAGAVYRTRTASLDEPELDKVADDLRHFLELLEQSLDQFVTNGRSGRV
ncbi:SMI1/KNR4 family protein [Actinacidiphila acidipaludis]|uniref:SMI1/KNR4 family protein n=1 Tax=Actinacidiphila acidipaludis TaxID=2873382 RepID=A0ABS7Q6M6_9ACTN|nr:SMI1/KNR4 family protein [Streptomyces acidipaludis]MBY8878389.1 SMI1/KNR4 family protein [Streptomyces acidipaludis]